MDSNKGEAERCVRIAKALLEEGNIAKGRKFLLKASRLYPSPSVDELLSKLGEKDGESGVSSNGNSASPFKAAKSSSRNENLDETSQSASEDQVEIVRRIKRTSDYYEILGLEKSCSEEDVKKAYRKLSLKIHPDKNKAPGAEEAFKLVSKAFQCLSNSELRVKYDQYGPEEARRLNDANGMRNRRHNDFFYEEVDPNEIFQNFFFGGQGFAAGFQRAHHVRTQHGARHFGGQRAEVHSTNTLVIVQLLAVLVLFFLSYFPFSQPIYSLQGGGSYAYAKTTSDHGVPYYVNSANFDRDYPLRSRGRRQIEGQVEGDYKEILIHNCRTEMNLHYFGRIKETPNCAKLEKFQRTY